MSVPAAKLTPQDVAGQVSISPLQLSKDAARIVYSVGPAYKLKMGDKSTSALWLADTHAPGSAHKITAGDADDTSPVFHPVTADIYFLSDRQKDGGPTQVYRLAQPLKTTSDNEPTIVTSDETQSVSSFTISPDGAYLAYISQPYTDKRADGPVYVIWREKNKQGVLHLLDLREPTKAARALVADPAAHVAACTWSPDSSALLFRTAGHPDLEAHYAPVTEAVVERATGAVRDAFVHARLPPGASVWRARGDAVYMQTFDAARVTGAHAVWRRGVAGGAAPAWVAAGEVDSPLGLVDMRARGGSQVAVEILAGLERRIDVIGAEGMDADADADAVRTVYRTSSGAIANWDMRATDDGRYVLAAVYSSGVSGEPAEVWSGEVAVQGGGEIVLEHKLSWHHPEFTLEKTAISKPFFWTARDGESLQGVISHPRGTEPQRMPTVVVPHGGPYFYDSLSLELSFSAWRQWFAAHGYLVLSPNYRGSCGRGDTFAKAAYGGMGTLEWDDVESMVDAAVAQGLADPGRLALAGYSQGGFLTNWGCTRARSRFRLGVSGAGVADWGMLVSTSDVPEMEGGLAGGAVWASGAPVYLAGSPLKDARDVAVPMLFVHGQEDRRVPPSQAVAMLRGIERVAHPSAPPQLVLYPREDHPFKERAHVEDMLGRILEFVDRHLR